MQIPCVVSIAGTDPSGGAGIQADIKAISATGSYAASVITALVAQNTQGVQAIHAVPISFVRKQLDAVFNDLNIKAVKIGMLHHAGIIEVVAHTLTKFRTKYVVLDPVMIAKDGSLLLDTATIGVLKAQLLHQVSLITPNLFEAKQLLNIEISTFPDMEKAARQLGQEFNINVLLKGGHVNVGTTASDVLYSIQDDLCHWLHVTRINTNNTHGTGCSLSAAIASFLAQGLTLYAAVKRAKEYLTNAIKFGSKQNIGRGHGPVDHFYFLRQSAK